MKNALTTYILKICSITMVLGVALGTIAVYLNERLQHKPYNSDWDNPFLNFIFFILIGIGLSIAPSVIFNIIVKLLFALRLPYIKLYIYLSGVGCTIIPFIILYGMVNEGEHRYNVIIYGACSVVAYIVAIVIEKKNLSTLIQSSFITK